MTDSAILEQEFVVHYEIICFSAFLRYKKYNILYFKETHWAEYKTL